MVRTVFAVACVLTMAVAFISESGACPVDSVALGGGTTTVMTVARFDTTDDGNTVFRAGYDLVAGTVRFEQYGSPGETFVAVNDDYDVAGRLDRLEKVRDEDVLTNLPALSVNSPADRMQEVLDRDESRGD